MVQFQLSSVQTQRQTPRRIAVSLPWFHHPGILVISTSSYMYWPTGAYPQAPRCAHKMVDGVPDWEKRFTNSKLTTEFYCNKKKTCHYVPSGWKKRGICWPVSRDHIMGSSLELIEITWVFENWPLTCAALLYWITGSCRVMSCQGRVVRKKQQTMNSPLFDSDPTLKPRSGGREQLVTNFNSWRFCVSENWLTTRQNDSMQGWSSVKPPKKVWLNYDLSIANN